MWPCTTNAVSGVDFTLFMTSDALTSMPLPQRGPVATEWTPPPSEALPDCLSCLRVPTSMRVAFELLVRMYPEQVRVLHQRQNWQLLRDGLCLRAPSVVP